MLPCISIYSAANIRNFSVSIRIATIILILLLPKGSQSYQENIQTLRKNTPPTRKNIQLTRKTIQPTCKNIPPTRKTIPSTRKTIQSTRKTIQPTRLLIPSICKTIRPTRLPTPSTRKNTPSTCKNIAFFAKLKTLYNSLICNKIQKPKNTPFLTPYFSPKTAVFPPKSIL